MIAREQVQVIGSIMETRFHQDFQVGNGREFNNDELNSLQKIYRQLTADFNPTPAANIETKITTSCVVKNQTIVLNAVEHETKCSSRSTSTLTIEYIMKYESRFYKMAHYPIMFRNWMRNNLNVVRARMQESGINVNAINVPISRELECVQSPGIKQIQENGPSSLAVPSPVALSVLTIGKPIGRRKREELKRTNVVDKPKKSTHVPRRYGMIRKSADPSFPGEDGCEISVRSDSDFVISNEVPMLLPIVHWYSLTELRIITRQVFLQLTLEWLIFSGLLRGDPRVVDIQGIFALIFVSTSEEEARTKAIARREIILPPYYR